MEGDRLHCGMLQGLWAKMALAALVARVAVDCPAVCLASGWWSVSLLTCRPQLFFRI